DRAGDEEAFLVAAAERLRRLIAVGAELETLEQLLDPAREIVGARAEVARVSAEVLRDGEVAVQRVVLRADADDPLELVAVLGEVAAVVLDDAGVGSDEPVEHAERR